MAFNPDDFLRPAQAPGFNPDVFLNEELSPDEQEIKQYQEQQAKFGGISNQLKAAVLGGARGATLGASDILAVKSGLLKPEELKGLKEANPITSGTTELGGGAALLGATGGAGALAEGAGTAARIGASALEGAAFGAGNALSDAAMGDPSLNAQKIAAHIGTGALFGAGLGGLGEVVKTALPPAVAALKKSLNKLKEPINVTEGLSGTLENAAPTWADQFNLGLKMGDQGPKIKSKELIKNLEDLHTSSKKAASALYEEAAPANISEALKDVPIDTARQTATNTVESMKNIVNGIGDITPEATTPLSSPASIKIVNSALDDLEHSVSKAKSAYEVQNSLSEFAKKIDAKKIIRFDKLPTAAQMADQEVLLNLRNTVRNNLKDTNFWGDAATHYKEVSDAYSAYKTSLKNFQSSFMKTEVAPSGLKRYVVDPTKVSSFFNRFDDLSQELRKKYLNDFISQTDQLAKASENYHGFIKGAQSISDHVSSLAHKNEELARVAKVMASNGAAKTGLEAPGMIAVGAHIIGVPDPIIGAALGASKAYQQISNPYQLGANLSGVFTKLKSIGEIVNKATSSIDSGTKSIFSNNTARAISYGLAGMAEKKYTKNSERIQELIDHPEKLTDHLEKTTSAITEAAPNISSGLHSTILRGVQFLSSKIPKPANELPLNASWSPTPSQKAKFNKYYNAVNDPISILKQIKSGLVSNEAMEALQVVHPELLQDMRLSVISHLNPKKARNLNYSTKIALSKFLGQPLESGMMPQVISANQAALAMPSTSQPQQPVKTRKSSVSGLSKLDGSDRILTRTQQLQKGIK